LGVILAWAALPMLVRLARSGRGGDPAHYYRALVSALLIATLIFEMPELVVSDATNLPFTTGFLRPLVVLPQSLLTRASFEQLEFVLHHELLHIARGDLRASLGIGVLRQLFAFHATATPLLSEIALAREASVDAKVAAGAPLQYAQLLVELAEHVRACRPLLAASLPLADAALTRRITMIISPGPSPGKAVGRRTQGILFAAAVCIVAGALLAPLSLEGAPLLRTCMEPVMLHFRFPPPEGGAQTVVFPIAFAPG
jgi:beta-lactamase regulating signal transducer with metallopeptidase domain